MDGFIQFLVICQAFGAFLGAVAALWGEFGYIRAMRDGNIDVAERRHLLSIAIGLRVGMTVLLFASLGLVIMAYVGQKVLQPALTSSYWILIVCALFIIGVTWALSRRRLSFAAGSATLFTAWWFLSYLTIGWLSPLSFGAAVALLTVATIVVYGLFYYIRMIAVRISQGDVPIVQNIPRPELLSKG